MMVDLRTSYLGLRLQNPLIASASPLTGNLESLRALEDYGAAAVVLPSLFEEDILQDRHALEVALDAGAGVSEVCGGYFPGHATEIESVGGAIETNQLFSGQIGEQHRSGDKNGTQPPASQKVPVTGTDLTTGLSKRNPGHQSHEERTTQQGC